MTISTQYYRGTHGVVLVYDITDRESFNKVQFWMNEIEKNASDNITIVLVGAKVDLEAQRQVAIEEGEQLAKQLNVSFIETSAKDAINVQKPFEILS
mmetsp:Transcript_6375/g.8279  ORF Transcript_6375/g.8279 Transcript_6375/m.8279 type:complete len:97 (+) Transcript_6375:234-524(+)